MHADSAVTSRAVRRSAPEPRFLRDAYSSSGASLRHRAVREPLHRPLVARRFGPGLGDGSPRARIAARRPAAQDLDRDVLPCDPVWLVAATPIMVPIVPERSTPRGVMAERRAAVPTGSAGPPLVIAPGPIEMPRSGTRWLVPAPARRMMVEVSVPRLRSQMPPGMMAVLHHLRRIVHDDFDAERGRDMSKTPIVAVGPGRRRNQGTGAEGRREQQHLTHGSPP
jgi:hypothetical protein